MDRETMNDDVARSTKPNYKADAIEDGFPQRLMDLIYERKITQTKLAELIGVSKATISNICSGNTKKLDTEFMLRITRTLGVSVEWLYTGTGRPTHITNEFHLIPFIDPAVELPNAEPIMLRRSYLNEKKLRLEPLAALVYHGSLSERWIRPGDVAIIDRSVKHIDESGLFCFKVKGSQRSYQLQYFMRLFNGIVKVFAAGSDTISDNVRDIDIDVAGKVVMTLRMGGG